MTFTRRPAEDFKASFEFTGGDYDTFEGSVMLEGPFTDSLSGSIYAGHRERDGFYKIYNGNGPHNTESDPTRNYDTFRGQLVFAPSEALDIRFLADYTKREEECFLAPNVFVGASGAVVDALSPDAGVLRPPNPAAFIAFGNRPDDQEVEDMGGSVEINWDIGALGDATLTSITATRSWETKNADGVDISQIECRPGAWTTGFDLAMV